MGLRYYRPEACSGSGVDTPLTKHRTSWSQQLKGEPVTYARSISAADFASDCPVPLGFVARLIRVEPDALVDLLDGIPMATRARLAVWLYGRSHTHAVGVRIAATCEEAALRRTAGFVGHQLYELSRQPYTVPNYGLPGSGSRRPISLGGSRGEVHAFG